MAPPAPPDESRGPAAQEDAASCGWLSDLPAFYGTPPRVVRLKLENFIRDAGTEQIRAWDESIPWLQRERKELVTAYDAARAYTAILEYELPREAREVDGVVAIGPPSVDRFLLECPRSPAPSPLTAEAFLQRDAYAPLPSLVRAARDLFAHQPLPRIRRAPTATEPARRDRGERPGHPEPIRPRRHRVCSHWKVPRRRASS